MKTRHATQKKKETQTKRAMREIESALMRGYAIAAWFDGNKIWFRLIENPATRGTE